MLLLGHTKFSAFKKYSNNDIVSEKNIFFPLLGGEVGGPDPKVKKFSLKVKDKTIGHFS